MITPRCFDSEAGYPAKAIGYKKASGKPWYFSEIKELERLQELPDGLVR